MTTITYNIVSSDNGEIFEKNVNMFDVKEFVERAIMLDVDEFVEKHPFSSSSKFFFSDEYKSGVRSVEIRKLVNGSDIGCSYSNSGSDHRLMFTTDEEEALSEIFTEAVEIAEKAIDNGRLTNIQRYIKVNYPFLKVAYQGGRCAIYGFYDIDELLEFVNNHENANVSIVSVRHGGQLAYIGNYYDIEGYVSGRGLDVMQWCDNIEVEMYEHGMSREQFIQKIIGHWVINEDEEEKQKTLDHYSMAIKLIDKVKENEVLLVPIFGGEATIENRYVMQYDNGNYVYLLAAEIDLM